MELLRRLRVRVFIALTTAAPIFAAVFGVLAIAPPARAVATVPYLINFQGRLTDNNGNVLTDGSYNVKFRIFDASAGGTNRWEGDRVYGASDDRVTVTNGLFNIQFGDTSKGDPALSPSLFNTQTYANLYLEVELPTPGTATCASNGCATWTEGAMTPRQPLSSSPYAFNSDALDGLDSSAFVQLNGNQTGSITISGALQSATATLTGANSLTLGLAGPSGNTGAVIFQDAANSNTVTLQAGTTSGNYTLTLPTAQASGTQLLQNNGSGVLSWVNPSGCTDCVLNDSAITGTTNTIAPTTDVSALTIRQTSAGSPTKNIFAITNSGGTSTYFSVDQNAAISVAAATSLSLSSGGSSDLSLSSGSGTINLTAGTLKRTAAGTTTLDLSDTANTTLAVANSGAGVANLTVDGGITAAGQVTFNRNGTGTGDYSVGITGTPVADSTSQLLRLGGSNIASGSANGTYIGANPASFSGDFINFQTNGTAALRLDSFGDQTTGFTQLDGSSTTNGTGNSKTSMVLTSVTNFDVGNYIRLQNGTACDSTATTCYAKITAVNSGTNTLTITPALTWGTGKTVDEWHIPEVGGLDTSQVLTSRYGRGYFISGVATGNGTTYYNEDSIDTSLPSFDLLNDSSLTTLNIGNAASTVNVPGALTVNGLSVVDATGQINGAQLQAGSVANTALANSALSVNTTGNLSGGGSVSLGGSLTLNTVANPTFSTSVTTPTLNATSSILLQPATDSATALQVLSSSGAGSRGVLVVGTSNTQVSADANLIVNSSVSLPTLTSVAFASNSGGTLSGASGTTYFYRISAIVGSETAASGEQWINTSAFTPLSAPSAPTAAAGASGGITGTYTYKYTYTTANGETSASPASGSVTVSNKKITVTIANGPTGTTGKKIYRTTTGPGTTWFLLTTIADNTTTTYTDSTADGSLGSSTAPSANTATTNLNSVTLTFPAFAGATGYRFYRGTSTRGEDHYQTASSCSGTCTFTDTGSTGTAGTPIDPTAGRVGIGVTSPGYALDVSGNISASSSFISNGNVGQTQTCGAGNTFSGLTVTGGIVTAVGSCTAVGGGGGGGSATLQSAYDNSAIPQINLSSGGGTLTVRDTSGGLGTDLLDVQDNTGATTYLGVSGTGITTSGSLTVGSTVTATGALTVQSTGATALTLDAGGAAAVTLGGTQANAVNIANQSTNAASVNIANNGTAHNIHIGDGAASNTTTIGSTTGGTTTLQAGGSVLTATTSSLTLQTTTNSGTAFQIQNAVGQTVLLADTTSTMTNGNTINYLNYSSFEVGTVGSTPTGWSNVGTANTVINNSKQHTYNGLFSAQTTFPATTGTGLQTSSFVSAPPSGTYIVSFYAKLTSGTNMTADKFVITSTDGATHTCSPANTTTLSSSTVGFQRVYCQFTATGTITNMSITVADTQARVIYLDAVQLQSNQFNGTTITTPTPFDYGAVQLRGVITNPLTVMNNGDSTSAFQIQNAAGTSNLFVADTLDGRIGIGTAAPAATLDVNGTANATSFTGTWQGNAIAATYGGTGQTTYAIGDLLYASSTSALSKLSEPVSAGSCLISGATGTSGPSWGSCSSAAGASTALDNLVTTNINQSLIPNADNSLDVGSASKVWAHAYVAVVDAGTTTTTLSVGTANATSITVGNTTAATALNLQGGTTGGLNLGATGSSTAGSTVNIATTANATGTQAVTIGSGANTANTVDIDAGTGASAIEIGDTSTSHGIKIGANASGVQTIVVGSGSSTSQTTISGGVINTSGGAGVIIGGGFSTSDTNLIALTLDSSSTFAEAASTCTASVNDGALYYNSSSNAVRACANNAWTDVVTSDQLNLALFGVVPDSGPTPGDWVGINGTLANKGPCKVYMGSTTSTIRWTGCTAYSGGRKVIIPAQSADQTITTGNGVWAHVCIYSSGSVTITQSSTETANAALTGADAWSATTPWLCLADVSTTNAAGGHIVEIYDTRTFTTSTKEIVNNITNANGLGWIMTQTATAGSVTRSGTTAGTGTIRGVVVSTAYTTTAGTMNMVIATGGPAYVKSTAGTVAQFVENTTTAGYAATTATNMTTDYSTLGLALSAFSSTCGASADTCRGSVAVNLDIR